MAGRGDFWNHMVLSFPLFVFKFLTFTHTLQSGRVVVGPSFTSKPKQHRQFNKLSCKQSKRPSCTQGCCFFFRCHAGETLQVDSLPLCICSFRSNLAGPSPFPIMPIWQGEVIFGTIWFFHFHFLSSNF